VRAAEKIDFLSTEFEIPATEDFENEVKIMCNLSEGIERKGIEKGITIGITIGIGIEIGIEIGDLKRAKKMIEDKLSVEMIERYTSLSVESIKELQLQQQ